MTTPTPNEGDEAAQKFPHCEWHRNYCGHACEDCVRALEKAYDTSAHVRAEREDKLAGAIEALEYYANAKAYDNVVGELLVADRSVAREALRKLKEGK